MTYRNKKVKIRYKLKRDTEKERTMELKKNEYVVFNINGKEYKAGWLEAVWNSKYEAFWITDDDGNRIFSNDVRVKAPRKKSSGKAPMVEINPDVSTEKAYGIIEGTNGCITPQNMKVFYKWIAKSICEERDGKIYAPIWAMR